MSIIKRLLNKIRPHDYTIVNSFFDEELINEKSTSYKPLKSSVIIENIINNLRNDKSLSGYLLLDENTPSPSKIIKYLIKYNSVSTDVMLYLIKNNKYNAIIKINDKELKCFKHNIVFIGLVNLDISINGDILNFKKTDDGLFATIYLNKNGIDKYTIFTIDDYFKDLY